MSHSTSAVRATEESLQPSVTVRSDGAVCCAEKMPRGRCKKLLATPEAEIICSNGHHVPLETVRDALLVDTSRSQNELQSLNLITVQDHYTWRKILRRLTAPDFMAAEWSDWQTCFLFRSPERFVFILHMADYYDRQTASMLRDYWEKHMRSNKPLIGRWLDSKTGSDRLACREQILRAYGSWHSPFPEGLLAKYEILAKAATDLAEPVARAYSNNIDELKATLANPRRPTFYYKGESGIGQGCVMYYNVLLDPEWISKIFTSRGDLHLIGCDDQLCFNFMPRTHDMKWNFQGTDNSRFREWFLGRFPQLSFDRPGIKFDHDSSDHINWHAPTDADRLRVEDDYDYAQQIIFRLVSHLNLSAGLPHDF